MKEKPEACTRKREREGEREGNKERACRSPRRTFPLAFLLTGLIASKEGIRGPENGDGHVSRVGHLPLKRTHCYVPIISFTLAANHIPSFPFRPGCTSKTNSCPFSLRTGLCTCPSLSVRRVTVNQPRGNRRGISLERAWKRKWSTDVDRNVDTVGLPEIAKGERRGATVPDDSRNRRTGRQLALRTLGGWSAIVGDGM